MKIQTNCVYLHQQRKLLYRFVCPIPLNYLCFCCINKEAFSLLVPCTHPGLNVSPLLASLSHSVPCLFEVLLAPASALCSVTLNAPWRSRPGSQATDCRWSQYLCRGRTSTRHRPPSVGPLGSTGTGRNGLLCDSEGHKIITAWPLLVDAENCSHVHTCMYQIETKQTTNATWKLCLL